MWSLDHTHIISGRQAINATQLNLIKKNCMHAPRNVPVQNMLLVYNHS